MFITYLHLYQGDKQGDIKMICPAVSSLLIVTDCDITFCPAVEILIQIKS